MATYVPAKVSTQYIFFVSLVSQANTKLMQVNPTIASGDFKVSIDGAALANLGTLPTVSPASSAMVKITLSTSEMAGANATVVCSDAAGAEWCDLTVNVPTAARQIDDLAFPATTGRSMVVDAAGLVDANMVKAGASGAGNTITTSGGVTLPAATIASTTNITTATGIDITKILGTAISTPATAGILDVNMKNIANAAVSTSTAQIGSNVVNYGGVAGTFTSGRPDVQNVVGNVTGSVGSVTGAVGSVTGNVGGNVVGSVGSVTTVTSIVTGLFAHAFSVAYNSFTFEQMIGAMASALAGKLSGAATSTVTIRNLQDSGNVIVASVDANGNRTSVTVTP